MTQPATCPLHPSSPWLPRATGDRLVYMVPSRSGGPDHKVDLAAYHANGKCDCRHFECRLEPDLARGAWPSPDLECPHIVQAKRQYCIMRIGQEKAEAGEIDEVALGPDWEAAIRARPGEWAVWKRMPDWVQNGPHHLVKITKEISRCTECTLHRLDSDSKTTFMYL